MQQEAGGGAEELGFEPSHCDMGGGAPGGDFNRCPWPAPHRFDTQVRSSHFFAYDYSSHSTLCGKSGLKVPPIIALPGPTSPPTAQGTDRLPRLLPFLAS